MTVQDRPVCFDCDQTIERLDDVVFSPPWCDHAKCSSASFHGLCLMRWRERRAEVRVQLDRRMEAFRRHVEGDCDCE